MTKEGFYYSLTKMLLLVINSFLKASFTQGNDFFTQAYRVALHRCKQWMKLTAL